MRPHGNHDRRCAIQRRSQRRDGTPTREAKGSQELGKDEFLRLLITQLRYQDPINPSKPEEFASQLAQFTSLERMQNIEDILASQSESNALTTLAMKADLGASFIGRQVLAAGNTLSVGEDGKAVATVDVGGGGGKTTVTVYDESGKEVAQQGDGLPFRWPSGTHPRHAARRGATATRSPSTSTSGAEVPVQTYTAGHRGRRLVPGRDRSSSSPVLSPFRSTTWSKSSGRPRARRHWPP